MHPLAQAHVAAAAAEEFAWTTGEDAALGATTGEAEAEAGVEGAVTFAGAVAFFTGAGDAAGEEAIWAAGDGDAAGPGVGFLGREVLRTGEE